MTNYAVMTELDQGLRKLVPHETNLKPTVHLIKILDATHYCYNELRNVGEHDVFIYKMSKTKTMFVGVILENMKLRPDKIHIFMQEGPVDYFQEWDTYFQIEYIKMLKEVDMVYAHNTDDISFFKCVTDKPIKNLFTPTDIELLNSFVCDKKREEKIMIGGNTTRWYNGSLSILIAKKVGIPITLPFMGRRHHHEEMWGEEVKVLPYQKYKDWIFNLSKHKYGIHMMPTPAAGSFHLDCAAIGIPCIGSYNIDTQKYCFPALSLKPTDLNMASKLLKRLKEDKPFYEHCSVKGKKKAKEIFSKELILKQVEEDIEELRK